MALVTAVLPPPPLVAWPGPGAAVLAHGAGSTPDLVRRAFGPALDEIGVRLVTWQQRPDPRSWLRELDTLVREHDAVLVGGVSLGAHLAARWAADTPRTSNLRGLLLVMPGGAAARVPGLGRWECHHHPARAASSAKFKSNISLKALR